MTYPNAALPFSSQVQFYGSQVPELGPNTVRVTQKEFAHDIAVLTFWADDVGSDSYVSGMPMLLTFGRSSVKRSFYGYVNHAQRINNALSGVTSLTARNSTVVTCVGASWFMKETSTRAWPAQTNSQIVEQIAAQFGLDANVVPHSTVWPVQQMAGASYWKFCVMLAKKIGYTFYCSGTQLVFKPRTTNPLNIAGLVATYDYRGNPGGLPVFSPVVGATNPTGGNLANRQLSGINPRTNQIIYSTASGSTTPTSLGSSPDDPVFTETHHDTIHSQQEADAVTSGAGQTNQLYITATATAGGDPLISQGSLVYVANANGSQNGLWFVEQAVQTLDTSTYSMALSLGRDSLGGTAVISGTPQIASPPIATLTGNKWLAVAA